MKIAKQQIDLNCNEQDIYESRLSLDDKHILELGCGGAIITRNIASTGTGRRVTALEVDEVAHAKNRQISKLPNVEFILAGAEDIPLPDDSVDVVFMFKSLHHVPLEYMDKALQEVRRVLRSGGFAYISEPVFAGEFNEVLRLFHDEQDVRAAAFKAISRIVDEGGLALVEEIFFNSPMHFESFQEFEDNTINATHSDHRLDATLHQLVKQRFEQHLGEDGAHFQMPIRVDLLQKP